MGRAASWSQPGVPRRPCRPGPGPEGQGDSSYSPTLFSWAHTWVSTHSRHALSAFSSPSCSRNPTLCIKPGLHVGDASATPHVPGTNPSACSALPWVGVARPSLGCAMDLVPLCQEGCPCLPPHPHFPKHQWRLRFQRRVRFTYGVSVQQALKVIKGADGAVTQHFIEFLRDGVPLWGRHQELSKLGSSLTRHGSPANHMLSLARSSYNLTWFQQIDSKAGVVEIQGRTMSTGAQRLE